MKKQEVLENFSFSSVHLHKFLILLQNQNSKEEQLRSSIKVEEINYGEYQFSNLTFNPHSTDSPEQETVCAQVQTSEVENPATETVPENPEIQKTE